jgi:hypothetical protein
LLPEETDDDDEGGKNEKESTLNQLTGFEKVSGTDIFAAA